MTRLPGEKGPIRRHSKLFKAGKLALGWSSDFTDRADVSRREQVHLDPTASTCWMTTGKIALCEKYN